MSASARLGLPLLAPGQTQKELYHNEALQALDFIVQGVCEGSPSDEPPAAPSLGATYLVGRNPVAAWTGHPQAVACWTEGGWRFRASFKGLELTLRSTGHKARYNGESWEIGTIDGSLVRINGEQVLSARKPAIAGPAGGTVIDKEARSTLLAVLAMLREHGLISN